MSPETLAAIARLRWRAAAAEKFSQWLSRTQLIDDDEKRESAERFFIGDADFIFEPDERTLLEKRDGLIRDALATHYDGMTASGAAKALAYDLARVASHTAPLCKDARQALTNIVELNGGKPLAWRQLLNIADGFRCG